MTKRTIEAYTAGLKFVNEHLIELIGNGIIIDFESAMRAALKKVAPNLPVLGCLFHHVQAVQRKMASMTELFELIRTNEDAAFLFRKFKSLALLPPNMIRDGFVSLLRETLEKHKFNQFAPFIDYYKRQWLNIVKPIHYSVFGKGTKTTGPAEAFNGKINKIFRTHGGFFQFVESFQKEEVVKADQFQRDVKGNKQPDRRNAFYKKRALLIEKYSNQLLQKEITTRQFLSIMANVNNEVICHEKEFFTDEVDIRMSIDTILEEGVDMPFEDNIITQESVELLPTEKQTTRKRKAATVETAPKSKRTRNTRQTTNAQTSKDKTSEATRIKVATNVAKKNAANKVQKPHVVLDDTDSDTDDTRVNEIMERITRNGSSMLKLRKRFKELEERENITIDPDCYKCIICYERKKNTILFPCLHQHTCGPCWLIYKIQQINSLPIDAFDENFDDVTKPKCPVCRQGVDEFKEARN